MNCEACAHLGTAAGFIGIAVTALVWTLTHKRVGRHHK